jgi:hypothetical protein
MPHSSDRTFIQFFLTMAFVIAMAIFNWVKRRSQSDDSTDTHPERRAQPPSQTPEQRAPTGSMEPRPSGARPLPTATPRPPVRKIDWEEELRRMIEGREPESPPAQEPVLREDRPAPVAVPPPLIFTPPPLQTHRPVPRPEPERGLPVQLEGLTVSQQSYQRASHLDETVAERLRQVGQQVARHAAASGRGIASMEVARALAMVHEPHALRSVVMASVILGPPKALEG